jgi:hypothetical protein
MRKHNDRPRPRPRRGDYRYRFHADYAGTARHQNFADFVETERHKRRETETAPSTLDEALRLLADAIAPYDDFDDCTREAQTATPAGGSSGRQKENRP